MSRKLILVGLLGAGCNLKNDSTETCSYENERWSEIRDVTSIADPQKVVVLHVNASPQEEATWNLNRFITITNMSTQRDCPVAIYQSETPPQVDLVEPLTTSVAEQDDNLGVLLDARNLAYNREDSNPESDALRLQSSGFLVENASEFEIYLSMVTCGTEPISIVYDLTISLGCIADETNPGHDQELSGFEVSETIF